MILNFFNDASCIRWQARRTDGSAISGKCAFGAGWSDEVAKSLDCDIDRITGVGYFLHHGGEYVKNTVNRITSGNFDALAKCVKCLPEYNDLTFKIASGWMKKLPGIPHVLVCDTAFFTRLPYEAKNYAIPHKLQQHDVRRYGRYGMSHLWISGQVAQSLDNPAARIVSVYLGDHTNIAAISGKKPMATSCGFTPIEGVLSATGSGSIDPTIIFYLHASGMSFKEINEMLSLQSGFAALLGGEETAGFHEALGAKKSGKAAVAREFYCYNVVKWMGSFIAVLGGVDVLVFFSEKPEMFGDVISEICGKFAFLGLGKPSSPIKTYCFQHDKWRVMEESVMALLKKGKITQ